MSKRIFMVAAGVAAILATTGVAFAQNAPTAAQAGAAATPQAQADILAAAIKAQIALLGANPNASDVQAAINTAVMQSGVSPTVAYAAIQAVSQTSTSAAVQTVASASASAVLSSVGNAAAQTQVQAQAQTLTQSAVVALNTNTVPGVTGQATNTTTAGGNNTTTQTTTLAANTNTGTVAGGLPVTTGTTTTGFGGPTGLGSTASTSTSAGVSGYR